jgi:hypothetical protein
MTATTNCLVTYTAGYGGPHSDPGVYRTNPVTHRRTFHAWSGLGKFPRDFQRREVVCAACGEDLLNVDVIGPCPNCDAVLIAQEQE